MGDLKQTSGSMIVQKKPTTVTMPVSELQKLVDDLHGDLVKEIDALKQRILLLEGKVAADLSERGLDDGHEHPESERFMKKLRAREGMRA